MFSYVALSLSLTLDLAKLAEKDPQAARQRQLGRPAGVVQGIHLQG